LPYEFSYLVIKLKVVKLKVIRYKITLNYERQKSA